MNSILPILFFLALQSMENQNSRTRKEGNTGLGEPEVPTDVLDGNKSSTLMNDIIIENYTEPKYGEVRQDQAQHEKSELSGRTNSVWSGLDENTNTNSKLNATSNKITSITRPSTGKPDLTNSLAEESMGFFNEQNGSFVSILENNASDTHVGDAMMLDWKKREDANVLTSLENEIIIETFTEKEEQNYFKNDESKHNDVLQHQTYHSTSNPLNTNGLTSLNKISKLKATLSTDGKNISSIHSIQPITGKSDSNKRFDEEKGFLINEQNELLIDSLEYNASDTLLDDAMMLDWKEKGNKNVITSLENEIIETITEKDENNYFKKDKLKYNETLQQQSYHSTSNLLTTNGLTSLHKTFTNSKLKATSSKDEKNSSSIHSIQPISGKSDSNNRFDEEKDFLINEQNKSFVSAPENNGSHTLQDDAELFDWRKREDSYKKTSPEEFPYSVLLIAPRKQGYGTCTGSIISAEWVLTASHCLVDAKNMIIYAGGSSLQEYRNYMARVLPLPETAQLLRGAVLIMHPEYKETANDCDIGLVRVEGKFNMTKYVNTVRLTTTPWRYHGYMSCNLTGFGVVQMNERSEDDAYRKTHILDVKNPCLCSFRLQIIFGSKTASRYICTKPKEDYGVCPGDSGSGLVCGGKVRGVAMQLVNLKDTEFCDITVLSTMQCGSINTLSVFEDICPFLPWINKHVKLFKPAEISPKCVYIGEAPRVHISIFWFLFTNIVTLSIHMFTN